jgi:hypothetical protein
MVRKVHRESPSHWLTSRTAPAGGDVAQMLNEDVLSKDDGYRFVDDDRRQKARSSDGWGRERQALKVAIGGFAVMIFGMGYSAVYGGDRGSSADAPATNSMQQSSSLRMYRTAGAEEEQEKHNIRDDTYCMSARHKSYAALPEHTLKTYGMGEDGGKMTVLEPYVTNVLKMAPCETTKGWNQQITDSAEEDYTVQWSAEAVAGSGHEATASFKFLEGGAGHREVTVEVEPANAQFWVTARVTNGRTGEEHVVREKTHVKHVRRELRRLTQKDRDEYFNTMQKMFLRTQKEGEEIWGKDFTSHGTLSALHNSQDYTYHGNLFFLTSHPAMQMRLERSLRAIYPAVATPYWDFLTDAGLGENWWTAPVYSTSWFGPAMTSKDINHRPLGKFFLQKRTYDPDGKNYPVAWHNAYGYLSDIESTTNNEYLTRSGTVCNFQLTQGFANCAHVSMCFEKFLANDRSLWDFDSCMERYVHANLHDMHAGMWDCAVDWQEFYDENSDWLSKELYSIVAVMQPAQAKNFYMSGGECVKNFFMNALTTLLYFLKYGCAAHRMYDVSHVRCPDFPSVPPFLPPFRTEISCPGMFGCDVATDTQETCYCKSNIKGITETSDVDNMDEDALNSYTEIFWDAVCDSSYGGMEAASVDATTGRCNPNGVTPDQLTKLNRHIMKTLLWPGNYGDMATGAAASDPLFWVMHQVFDKALHALRLSPTYNKGAFKWDQNTTTSGEGWASPTPFKYTDFEPYLGAHHPGDTAATDYFLTNEMLWNLLAPNSGAVPYVYDQLTNWGSCRFDPME